MKKTLLSMAAMLLLATGASAQKMVKEFAVNAPVSVGNFASVKTLATPKSNGMKKIVAEETLIAYPGADNPAITAGWPSQKAIAVGAQMGDIAKYAGWEILGLRFAVGASLGKDAGIFVYSYTQTDGGIELEGGLTDSQYNLSLPDEDNVINLMWNDLYFQTPAKLTADDIVLQFGLTYTQNTDQTSTEARPFFAGKCSNVSDDNYYGASFIVYIDKWYMACDQEESPYALCAAVIAKDPTGTVHIIGVDGSDQPVAQQYYSVNGAQLSAPQKGLNIVKMSNGETMKVLVK